MTIANQLSLAKGLIPLDAVTYESGEAIGWDFTPSGAVTIPAGGRLRAGKIFGSYTLGEGARFDGYATDVTVDGPAGANAYAETNVLHAKGALNAKPGYDRVIACEGFTGVSIPTVSATEFRSGQAYAGAHQISLEPLDAAAVADSVRRVQKNSAGVVKVKVLDDIDAAVEVQEAFRRGRANGPGAWDVFLNPDGTVRYQVTQAGVVEHCGQIAKGPSEFRSPVKFVGQQFAEFVNGVRSYYLQAISGAGYDYFRILVAGVGEVARFLASGALETMGAIHANAAASPPAGGSASVGVKVAGIGWYVGTGDPTLSAAVGSKYTDVAVPRDWKMTGSGWVLA